LHETRLKASVIKLATITVPAMAIALVVLAAAVEVWVRMTANPRRGTPGFFLADAARRDRLAANYSGWFAGVPVHINSLELRDDREYDLEKKPNTFRILVLGDSVTFGHGSVYEHTYPYLLEQQLRRWRPDVDWQVWNAAVPGYNTSQELAQLLEVGPRFKPDLVIVGFYENDIIDNYVVTTPGRVAVFQSKVVSFLKRHLFSLELYKRQYLALRWKLSASDEYRRRLEHIGTEESLLADVGRVAELQQQQLTPYERLTDEQVAGNVCDDGQKTNPQLVADMQKDPGWPDFLRAGREFHRLHANGVYRILFFLNVIPPICPDGDMFYDGGSKPINEFLLRVLGEGSWAFSAHDAFLHRRPSQMPNATAHAIGNSNMTKAEALFGYLKDHLLPTIGHPALARAQSSQRSQF
jgi:hypothetical protein